MPGLANLGNTCFLNATIQALFHTNKLKKYLVNYPYPEKCSRELIFAKVLSGLMKEMEGSSFVVPMEFRKVFSIYFAFFRGNGQHDAHESLMFILEMLHQGFCESVEMKITGDPSDPIKKKIHASMITFQRYFSKEYSMIISFFYGQLHSEIKCLECNRVSDSYDPFHCLSLPIPEQGGTLYDCIDLYQQSELLSLGNEYSCEHCKKKVQSHKRITVWNAPKILIVQLIRFKGTSKNDTPIKVPLNLDLTKYINPLYTVNGVANKRYSLYSVIVHSGTPSGGHYYNYSKTPEGWFCFDDTNVSPVVTKEFDSGYTFFYEVV